MNCSCNRASTSECPNQNNQFNKLRQCWSNHLKCCIQENQNVCACYPPPTCPQVVGPKPKVKGKFGVAYVIENPVKNDCCKKAKPCGWQIEFNDTPSKVEYNCKKMLNWVTCPPLGECQNNDTTICCCSKQPPPAVCCYPNKQPKNHTCCCPPPESNQCCCQKVKEKLMCKCCEKKCCCASSKNVPECCCSKKESSKCCCQKKEDESYCCRRKTEEKVCCCCNPEMGRKKYLESVKRCAACCCKISEKPKDHYCCLCSKKITKKDKPCCCCNSSSSLDISESESEQGCCRKKEKTNSRRKEKFKEKSKKNQTRERKKKDEEAELKKKKKTESNKSKPKNDDDDENEKFDDESEPKNKHTKSKNQTGLKPAAENQDDYYKELTEKVKGVHEKHKNLRQDNKTDTEEKDTKNTFDIKELDDSKIELTSKNNDLGQNLEDKQTLKDTETKNNSNNNDAGKEESEILSIEYSYVMVPSINENDNSSEKYYDAQDIENNKLKNKKIDESIQNLPEKPPRKKQGHSLLKKIRKEHKKEVDMIHHAEGEGHQHPMTAL